MKKIKWENIFFFTSFHLLAIAGFFFFEWLWLIVGLILWRLMHLGLAVGYHRYLIHQGFKASRWLEKCMTICGSLTMQGSHLRWIAVHWLHHVTTETKDDPHSPRNGFIHSHIGWMIRADPTLDGPDLINRYAKRLSKDRFHHYFSKIWWLPGSLVGITLFLIGGVPAILLGFFLPVTLCLHSTWLVNSVCHRFGSKPNDTDDDSRNNWFVALLTCGEGWHNNHHDDPARARHGLKWYQFDSGWICIRTFAFFGWATEIKT